MRGTGSGLAHANREQGPWPVQTKPNQTKPNQTKPPTYEQHVDLEGPHALHKLVDCGGEKGY